MRIATWNVNSLRARLDKVTWWLERARPDVLLMQETKLADDDLPLATFERAGYTLTHHGEGRWNGVAIASRVGAGDVITNFGEPIRGAQIYVKIRLEPNPSIVWLHFHIHDEHGSLSRAALIETANQLLVRPIGESDNVLPTLPAAGDAPPVGGPQFQDLWLQIGAARAYAGRE